MKAPTHDPDTPAAASADPRPTTPTTAGSHPPPATVNRPDDYIIYKANSRGTGGAIRFGLNRAKAAVFVDAANQAGEKQFDWERKITMKLGLPDIGALLAILQGRQLQAKLFHRSEKANSALELTSDDDPQHAPYLLKVSRQEEADKSVRKVAIPVTHAEVAVLETALRFAVGRLVGW